MRGKETWLIWSDARQNPDKGVGDIYLTKLDTRSLAKIGDETRIFASNAHSRSPILAATTSGAMVAAWIEEAAGAAKQAGGIGVRIGQLDDKGALVGTPVLVRGRGEAGVTSFALGCAAKKCRGALTSALGPALELDAFEFVLGSAPLALKTLATLTGGATQDAALTFPTGSAESLFFADDAVAGTGRLRWMTIAWP